MAEYSIPTNLGFGNDGEPAEWAHWAEETSDNDSMERNN
jgi:hypothetical protein